MTDLVALISTGKGTWTEVAKIITSHDWDKIFLITNEFGSQTFNKKENMEFIIINPDDKIETLIEKIKCSLDDKLSGTDVALNLSSGSGKEHMVVLSALLKLGLGIRLITYSNDELKEI